MWNGRLGLLKVRMWVREVCRHHGVEGVELMRVAQAGEAQVLGEFGGVNLATGRDCGRMLDSAGLGSHFASDHCRSLEMVNISILQSTISNVGDYESVCCAPKLSCCLRSRASR